ncbi:hypothetical protein NDU88_007212 [Pleurodeles waltl]|uniref:Uncharacterized protein n=1 Tax=Pleurodeles waltl TaxID=8319 RepID=A0AAV7RU94_PLEWA|nr:hypothetical protein NDU88_007212 [Pleurodeles waltl]
MFLGVGAPPGHPWGRCNRAFAISGWRLRLRPVSSGDLTPRGAERPSSGPTVVSSGAPPGQEMFGSAHQFQAPCLLVPSPRCQGPAHSPVCGPSAKAPRSDGPARRARPRPPASLVVLELRASRTGNPRIRHPWATAFNSSSGSEQALYFGGPQTRPDHRVPLGSSQAPRSLSDPGQQRRSRPNRRDRPSGSAAHSSPEPSRLHDSSAALAWLLHVSGSFETRSGPLRQTPTFARCLDCSARPHPGSELSRVRRSLLPVSCRIQLLV